MPFDLRLSIAFEGKESDQIVTGYKVWLAIVFAFCVIISGMQAC